MENGEISKEIYQGTYKTKNFRLPKSMGGNINYYLNGVVPGFRLCIARKLIKLEVT